MCDIEVAEPEPQEGIASRENYEGTGFGFVAVTRA